MNTGWIERDDRANLTRDNRERGDLLCLGLYRRESDLQIGVGFRFRFGSGSPDARPGAAATCGTGEVEESEEG